MEYFGGVLEKVTDKEKNVKEKWKGLCSHKVNV